MKILVACEYSDTVSAAFRERGHDVTSCDLLPSENPNANHIQGDVRPLLHQEWDMVLAFPPCTHLTNLTWNWGNPDRIGLRWWWDFYMGAGLFRECLAANAPLVAVENPPLMHPQARAICGTPDWVTDLANFGSEYRKRIGLWLKGLPPLMATMVNPNPKPLFQDRETAGRRKRKGTMPVGINQDWSVHAFSPE